MNILSIEFVKFFSLLFIVYWVFQPFWRVQNIILVAGSIFFLSWGSYKSLYIIIAWTLCLYSLALYWRKTQETRKTNIILCLLVAGFFFVFRFYPALQEAIKGFFEGYGVHDGLPMVTSAAPLGLSFYIFHSISYILSLQRQQVDKNRGAFPAHSVNGRKESFFSFFIYTSFFPSIVSGPINRAVDLLPQLLPFEPRRILFPRRAVGLIVLAIVKLFLVSDYLDKHLVGPVFSAPSNATPAASLVAVLAYAWQIYMNFSGYTDLVRGMGLLLGFQLPENFNAPYLATNVSDFWRRWHISLSRFITDYIYIPLGGNRRGFARQNLNVMVAMVLSGLWHGVGFTFLIWGALHGVGLVALNGFKHLKKYIPESLQARVPQWLRRESARFVTFAFLCLTWVFFRAATYDDAMTVLWSLTHCVSGALFDSHMLVVWGLIGMTAFYPIVETFKNRLWAVCSRIPWWTYPFFIALILTCVFMFAPAGTPGFIYANF